jgi:16S rRNA (cytosine967-C5)-methyltransferase
MGHIPDLPALVVETCAAIIDRNMHADSAIHRLFQEHSQLSQQEKAEIVTAVYDIVRYARWLCALNTSNPAGPLAISPSAYETWRLWRGLSLAVTEADREILARIKQYSALRPLRESIPDWLDEIGQEECGERWEPLLRALNSPPLQVLRANTLKTATTALVGEAARMGYHSKPVEWAAEAVVLAAHAPVFQWECFKKGWFEVQDAASQAVAAFLEVRPGMRVVDGCAGNGGKTLHLAALMHNKGRIIALDPDEGKLEELERRARRAGAQIIDTRVISSTKIIKRLAESADRVLLDLPCSGTGVWRRNPDAKWHLRPEDLPRLRAQQQQILAYYSRMVKPGGRLVYATCSVLPSEGEDQVAKFLAESGTRFSLAAELRLDPDTHGFDGFYMAALVCNPASNSRTALK